MLKVVLHLSINFRFMALWKPDTDISNAEQGKQESSEGSGKGEELPVSLEDLKVIS